MGINRQSLRSSESEMSALSMHGESPLVFLLLESLSVKVFSLGPRPVKPLSPVGDGSFSRHRCFLAEAARSTCKKRVRSTPSGGRGRGRGRP